MHAIISLTVYRRSVSFRISSCGGAPLLI